jgi:hypothetical protein
MNTPALLLATALGCASLSAAPTPLLLWDFDEGGGAFTSNRGTAGEADLHLLAHGGGTAEAFSVAGRGVSEKKTDHAFDLTTANGMGATTPNSTGPAGVAWSNSFGLASLSGLTSFTLSGWLKPTATINRSARVVASPTLTLMAGVENCLSLQVNGQHSDIQSEPLYHEVGAWIFFAVTYDGTRNTQNVVYYVGSTTPGSLVQAGVTTIDAGALKPFTGQLVVGNNSSTGATTRPFMGMIDEIALHASKTDDSGALSLETIETIRAAALR